MEDFTYLKHESHFECVRVGENPNRFILKKNLDPSYNFEGNKEFIKHLIGIPDASGNVIGKHWPNICLTFLFQIPSFNKIYAFNCVCINVYLRTDKLNEFKKPGSDVFKNLLFNEFNRRTQEDNEKLRI